MRDILVHAASYLERDPAQLYAARLAASQRAALTAVYVPPALPVLPEYNVETVISAYAAWIEQETRAARDAASGFESWAVSLGARHARWEVADGEVSSLLRHAGHWHDLLVVGAGGDGVWQSEGGLAQLITTTRLPCVVVPQGAGERDVRHPRVAVAWNGAVEAIGALHAAMPWLQAAQRVVVLAGTLRPTPAGVVPFDLDGWADQHGVQLEYLMLEKTEDVGSALLAAAAEVSADLLVAGAYGRSRMAEWVLGGVTRHLLRHSPLPLLLRH